MPDAQSDVHLRGRDVSHKHITTHSGSAQDSFAERSSDARVTHVAKANTPSSNQQKATYTDGAMITAQSSTKHRRRKRKRANSKRAKQDEQLIPIELPDSSSICVNVPSQGSIIFVDGGMFTNPPICPTIPLTDIKNNQHVIIIPVSGFKIPTDHLHLSAKGLFVTKANQPSQIILVPRGSSLKHTGMCQNLKASTSLCDALDGVESGTRTSNNRGSEKHAIHQSDQKY